MIDDDRLAERQARARAREAEDRRQELDTLKALLGTSQGRLLVWRWLSRCGVYRVSFAPGSAAADVAFREGRRNVGLMLLRDVERVAPEALERMRRENTHHEDMTDVEDLA